MIQFAALTSTIALTAIQQPIGPLDFRSAVRNGGAYVSAVSPDLTVAYVSEGDQVAIFNLPLPSAIPTPPVASQAVVRVPINATIMSLVRNDYLTDQQVFIAGGSFGLLRMNAQGSPSCTSCTEGTVGCHEVVTIDDNDLNAVPAGTGTGKNERWCWDVAIAQASDSKGAQTYVVALFSGQEDQGGTELRVYERGPLSLVARLKMDDVYSGALAPGTPPPPVTPHYKAFGFALDTKMTVTAGIPQYGSKVYVAMGTGGVLVIDLAPLVSGGTATGIVGQQFPATGSLTILGQTYTANLHVQYGDQYGHPLAPLPGIVRDISVADGDGSVFAAADTWGAAEIDRNTGMALSIIPLTPGADQLGATWWSHANQIDAVLLHEDPESPSVYVAIGGHDESVLSEHIAPYLPYGRFSYRIGLGGDDPAIVTGHPRDALYFFSRPANSATALAASDLRYVEHGSLSLIDASDDTKNGGHFTLRASTSPADDLWLYNQTWRHGGERSITLPGSTTPLPTSFQWITYTPYFYSASRQPLVYHSGIGANWIAFTHLKQNANLVLGQFDDGLGAVGGALAADITNRSCIAGIGPPIATGAGVFQPSAHWVDSGGKEWFIGANEAPPLKGSVLYRLTYPGGGGLPAIDTWRLRDPKMPNCYAGFNYHRSTSYFDPVLQEDRIFATFDGGGGRGFYASSWAGVVYRRRVLTQRASMVSPGQALFPGTAGPPDNAISGTMCFSSYLLPSGNMSDNYVAPVEIHNELQTWVPPSPTSSHIDIQGGFVGESRVCNYMMPDGTTHAFAVIAAGANWDDRGSAGIPTDPQYSRPKLVLLDLNITQPNPGCVGPTCQSSSACCPNNPTDAFRAPPGIYPPLPAAGAPDRFRKGMTSAVEIVENQGFRFALASDFGGRLLIYDISQGAGNPPVNGSYRQSWILPRSMIDGFIDNVADIEVDTSGLASEKVLVVYLAVYRIGIVKLSLRYRSGYNPALAITDSSGNGVPFDLPPQNPFAPSIADYYVPGIPGVEKRDTPGLAHSLKFINTSGVGKGLLLADKWGGLRLYGDF